MRNMKFIGMCVPALIFACVVMWGVNFANAEEKTDIGEIGEKPTKPEHEYEHIQRPECPICKEGRLGPEKGRTVAKMTMTCPDCKNEISELSVHQCDKCGKDILTCVLCEKASEGLQAATGETVEAACPTCKEVRTRPIKGKAFGKWKMKCPDCSKEPAEWLIEHCDKCGEDFLSCPVCKKTHESKT